MRHRATLTLVETLEVSPNRTHNKYSVVLSGVYLGTVLRVMNGPQRGLYIINGRYHSRDRAIDILESERYKAT